MGPIVTVVYTLLWACALPYLLLSAKMRGGFKERLGLYPNLAPSSQQAPRIWMHGASAGDVLALAPTARALRARLPHCTLVVTTLTQSGVALGRAQGALFDHVLLSPMDVPFLVRRAFVRIKPSLLVLEYTELWPALIGCAHRRGVPIALHNGRFSAQGLWRYRLLFRAIGPLLPKLQALLMRDTHEAQRALSLGALPRVVSITGNTKFDNLRTPPMDTTVRQMRAWQRLQPHEPLLVCGSTHEGEEAPLIALYQRLKRRLPKLRLVLAPRYIERAPKLVALCHQQGLTASLRSQGGAAVQDGVMIVDTLGELAACYTLATVSFVGGSFVARGGQNILEPAALACPVVFGPNMKNFTDAVAALLGRGGIQVQSFAQLHQVLSDLLADAGAAKKLGRTAQMQVQAIRGAAERNAQALVDLLPAKTPVPKQ